MNKIEHSEAETVTGRIVKVPESTRYLVFGLFGVQARKPEAAASYVAALREQLVAGNACLIERSHYVDQDDFHTDVFMAYWLDVDSYRAWIESPRVAEWWADLPQDPAAELGFWREVLMPDKDRFQFGGAGDRKAASANFLELEPCNKFGYWGGYRDRLDASVHDDFAAAFDNLPAAKMRETKGCRLSVITPDNLCFLREGQGWEDCGTEERRIWNEKMEDVVTEWVGFLGNNPTDTGCMSIRDCLEQDVSSGAPVDRRSQFAFLLSLGHIEHAARTQPTHLAVRNTFLEMFDAKAFEPQLHVWVEVFVIKAGELDNEYVNCHPGTGLLPYFELRDAAV